MFVVLRNKQQVNLSVRTHSVPAHLHSTHHVATVTSSSRMLKTASVFIVLLGLLFVSSQTDEVKGRSEDSTRLVSPIILFNVLTSCSTGKVLIPKSVQILFECVYKQENVGRALKVKVLRLELVEVELKVTSQCFFGPTDLDIITNTFQ